MNGVTRLRSIDVRLFIAYLAGLPARLRYWFVVRRRRSDGPPCLTAHVWSWEVARFVPGQRPFVTFHCLNCSATTIGDHLPTPAEQITTP